MLVFELGDPLLRLKPHSDTLGRVCLGEFLRLPWEGRTGGGGLGSVGKPGRRPWKETEKREPRQAWTVFREQHGVLMMTGRVGAKPESFEKGSDVHVPGQLGPGGSTLGRLSTCRAAGKPGQMFFQLRRNSLAVTSKSRNTSPTDWSERVSMASGGD